VRKIGIQAVLLMVLAVPLAWAAPSKPSQKAESPKIASMSFVIVRSSKPGCEPNCPEWIAAEGEISSATPQRFKAVLARLGKTQLPVVLNSPGGDVGAAMQLGRMIRKHKLNTGVGYTKYEGCAPTDKACKAPKEWRGVYRGLALDDTGYCFSACPLVLAGGVERLAGPSTLVGVHQVRTKGFQQRITYRETYRMVRGKKKVISRKVVKNEKVKQIDKIGLDKRLRGMLVPYLAEMGISKDFLVEMEKAPPSSINIPGLVKIDEMGLITSRFPLTALTGNSNCEAPKTAPNCVLVANGGKP
jgi:hypothetical protein